MHETIKLNPADPQQSAADRELQRAALRDLVALLTDCAKSEAEIEQRHLEEVAAEDQRIVRETAEVDQRIAARREELTGKYDARAAEIISKHTSELDALNRVTEMTRVRMEYDKDSVERETKKELDQACWLAESVFDGTIVQIKEDFRKAKEQAETDEQWIDQTERRVRELLDKLGFAEPPAEPRAAAATTQTFAAIQETIERQIAALSALTLPRIFVGATPYLIVPIVAIIAGVAAQFLTGGESPQWGIVIGSGIGAIVLSIVAGVVLHTVGRKRVIARYVPLRDSLDDARLAVAAQLEQAEKDRDARARQTQQTRDEEVRAAKGKVAPYLAKAAEKYRSASQSARAEHAQKQATLDSTRNGALEHVESRKLHHVAELQAQFDRDTASARANHETRKSEIARRYREDRQTLERRWSDGLARIHAPIDSSGRADAAPGQWDGRDWKTWTPPKTFPATIPFGQLTVDLRATIARVLPNVQLRLPLPETFTMPALLAFPKQSSLFIQSDHRGRGPAIQMLQMLMSRLLTNFPPGRVRFIIFDPQGLGQNFAGFMHLADYDESLVGKRIWTNAEHIEQRLTDLTEHMETVIQKYLRNEFETIDDYNMQAGELAEPYRFLVIADFPVGFQGDSLRRLASIASTGARCGVYTLIARDTRHPLPAGAHMEELEAHSVNLIQEGDRFVWKDEIFRQFALALDPPPPEETLTQILHVVGQGAKDANRVEVPFDAIAPGEANLWCESGADEIRVPIGRLGATRNQLLRLGRGVAQHALIAGKTGSGKSTLLHAIITNLAMWYSPEEVEFYLIDFKKGVEFKTYATHSLPHARAIAVESDREFGLSVLQRIDAELARRGEIYRKAGVQDLAAYRQSDGAKVMPRVLLIIDEFQEFFSEDDRVAQEATVLLDRLVRQGRAFGIHVLLGSQTIGGTSGLARSTLGQMAIRIALQCSEADSQLILGDNNSAARLLSRPGEAIYNDAGGLVEGNSPFQVAWLPDERRDVYLERIDAKAREKNLRRDPPIVFEGNAPADIGKNLKLAALLDADQLPAGGAPRVWLGDPVAIKEPTTVTFRRQSGSNLLIVGQHEEAAMAMLATAMIGLAAQRSSSAAKFYVFDGSPADSPLAGALKSSRAALPHDVRMIEYRDVAAAVVELSEELQRRQASDQPAPKDIFVLIYGLQRYRALRRQADDFSFSTSSDDEKKQPNADKQFADLLREGPALGIHIIAWADTAVAVDRTLDRGSLREFDNRVLFQMSAADSSNLIDSPLANKLGMYRAISYSEEQGVTEKFRPYALPKADWLRRVKERLGKA